MINTLLFLASTIIIQTRSEPILNVSHAFWITIHPENKPPVNIWPGLIPEIYIGLRGDDTLLKYCTSRVKHSIIHQQDDGFPSTNAIALYLNHVNIWKNMKPGEIVAIFEDDAMINSNGHEIIEQLDDSRMNNGNKSLFFSDTFYLSMYSFSKRKFDCKKDYNFIITTDTEKDLIEDISCTLAYGTSAYLIGYSAAQQLLRNAFPIENQIDSYILLEAMFMQDPNIHFLGLKHTIYSQNNDDIIRNIFFHKPSEIQRFDYNDLYKTWQFALIFKILLCFISFTLGNIIGHRNKGISYYRVKNEIPA